MGMFSSIAAEGTIEDVQKFVKELMKKYEGSKLAVDVLNEVLKELEGMKAAAKSGWYP